MGVDQVPLLGSGLHQHQTQQRCMAQIESLLTLGIGQRRKGCRLIVALTPVENAERQLHLFVHDLQRLRQFALPDETAAQNVLRSDGGLPCGAEALRVKTLHIHAQLVDVLPRRLLVEGVEQQPLLHRRQRIDIIELTGRHRQRIQLRLGHPSQREVRRRRLRNG